MASLKDILYGVKLLSFEGERELVIKGITFDSRKVESNFLFVAVKGLTVDGHQFIEQAISMGATAILAEELPEAKRSGVAYVQTDNTTQALGMVAANFYDNPSQKLRLVGVTGTNGKTTTVTLAHDLFTTMGYKTGLLSTVENKIGTEILPSAYTTPDAVALNKLLAEMVRAKCTHAFMEVSSHALMQGRVSGLVFSGGVFTNITHDHLDYHETFDAYIAAKKMLFDMLPVDAFALSNADDKRGQVMLQNCKADKNTYALKAMADYKGKLLTNSLSGLEMDVDGVNVWFKLIGAFNAYNLLSVYAMAILLEEDANDVLTVLSQLKGARGRFEYVQNVAGVLAIVDYAHTPDALENVLSTIDGVRSKNETLITVVGCGGDRDAEKRPKMAAIACSQSDKVILTSDNPRTEDPEAILDDMWAGVPKTAQRKTLRILDRREAIRTACALASKQDIILVAGKGHETYQEVNGERSHFDDKEILTEILN
ncbi:MAG: UDP-N-acetylmuramoyl-L-alanyl-D-glutamate--2,6-diaminopimelate ligase [Cyclobacteriaceae bacterium]